MAIQYAASFYYSASVTGATRALLADAIKNAMVSAGWTLNRTAAASDYYLESAVAPNSLQVRARVYDPGAGNCARVYILNTAETVALSTQPVFLLPGITYFFSGNAYHCLMQEATWTSVGRTFGMWGTGYTESFASGLVSAIGFQCGNGVSDTSTANTAAWSARFYNEHYGILWNGSSYQLASGANNGNLQFVRMTGPTSTVVPTKWAVDDALHVWEPLLMYSTISHTDTTDIKVRCQLYDTLIMAGSWGAGTVITWDSKTWVAVTHLNTGDYLTLFARKT